MYLLHYFAPIAVTILLSCKTSEVEDQNIPGSTIESLDLAAEKTHEIYEKRIKTAGRGDISAYRLKISRARPGDTIHLPPEVFTLSEPLEIRTNNLTIIGDSTILWPEKAINIINGHNVSNLSISGIVGFSKIPVKTNLLRMQAGTNLKINSCHAVNMGLLYLSKDGDLVHKNLSVVKSSAVNAGADGIKLQAVSGFYISDCRFVSCGQDGIKTNVAPCENGVIQGCYFENNKDDGFDLFGGGSNILIDSSTFVNGKVQLKNIGGAYFRKEVHSCTIRNSFFQNVTVICLSKYIPETEFIGLRGIVIEHNTWINDLQKSFVTNGAVNYRFENNNILIKEGHTAIDIRPPLDTGIVRNNTIKSGINQLDTDPKKGVYLLATKKQFEPKFGEMDSQGHLIIDNNKFINGRRDFLLEGLANYTVENNTSMDQNDRSIYLGVNKTDPKKPTGAYHRKVRNNKVSNH